MPTRETLSTLLTFFISAFDDDSIRPKINWGGGSRNTIRVGTHFRLSIAQRTYLGIYNVDSLYILDIVT